MARREYAYWILDVFTDQPFSGNQLAVLPHAEGLSAGQMQRIAREFNFSESAFVFPAEGDGDFMVRIFTPSVEVPFAGHPNIGTAFLLAELGMFRSTGEPARVIFEEKAGPVPIDITGNKTGQRTCSLQAPEVHRLGARVDPRMIAQALGIKPQQLTNAPQVASSGLPFVMAEVDSAETLASVRTNLDAFRAIEEEGVHPDIFVYVPVAENQLQARMFAPLDGVPEDPATGSAACAVAGYLAGQRNVEGRLEIQILQGETMGRSSLLNAYAVREAGEVRSTGVAGTCVLVAGGKLFAS